MAQSIQPTPFHVLQSNEPVEMRGYFQAGGTLKALVEMAQRIIRVGTFSALDGDVETPILRKLMGARLREALEYHRNHWQRPEARLSDWAWSWVCSSVEDDDFRPLATELIHFLAQPQIAACAVCTIFGPHRTLKQVMDDIQKTVLHDPIFENPVYRGDLRHRVFQLVEVEWNSQSTLVGNLLWLADKASKLGKATCLQQALSLLEHIDDIDGVFPDKPVSFLNLHKRLLYLTDGKLRKKTAHFPSSSPIYYIDLRGCLQLTEAGVRKVINRWRWCVCLLPDGKRITSGMNYDGAGSEPAPFRKKDPTMREEDDVVVVDTN